jgi:molybdopterin converting factor small subunit
VENKASRFYSIKRTLYEQITNVSGGRLKMKHIKFVFYGPLADLVGRTSFKMEFDDSIKQLKDAINLLCEKLPVLKDKLSSIALVKNNDVVSLNEIIEDKDTIGLLPPISGG